MYTHVKKWLTILLLSVPISIEAQEFLDARQTLIPTFLLTAPVEQNDRSFLEIAELLLEQAELSEAESLTLEQCVKLLSEKINTIEVQEIAQGLEVMRSAVNRAPREQGPNPIAGACTYGCNFSRLQGALNRIADSVENCCPIWTALTEDIITTLTGCCVDLQVQFDGLIETLMTLSVSPVTGPSFVDTITACCAQVQSNFQGTWTALDAVTFPCSANSISAPLLISTSGIYCLEANITGQITIDANNVVLDLNGYTISNNGGSAIVINSGFSNIVIKNGFITDVALNGITVNDNCSKIELSELQISSAENVGIFAENSAAIVVRAVQVSNAQIGFAFSTVDEVTITGCSATDIIGTTTVAAGFVFANGSDNIQVVNCQAAHSIVGSGQRAYGFLVDNSDNVYAQECVASNINSNATERGSHGFAVFGARSVSHVACSVTALDGTIGATFGFLASNALDVVYDRCTAMTISAGNVVAPIAAAGFFAENSNGTTYIKCLVSNTSPGLSEGCSFGVTNVDGATYKNCTAQIADGINSQYGFYVAPSVTAYSTGVTYDNCIALAIAGYGFYLIQGSGLLYECMALDCTLGGFRTDNTVGAPAGRWAYNECIASNNLGDGFIHIGAQPPAAFNCFANFNTTNYTGIAAVFNQGDTFDCLALAGGIPAAGNISG